MKYATLYLIVIGLALISPVSAGATATYRAGLITPDRGSIRFQGHELIGLPDRKFKKYST